MENQSFFLNGIDAETGEYLTPPLSAQQVAALAQGESLDAETRVDMKVWLQQGKKGLRSGEERDLSQAGWGILFARDDPQTGAIREKLKPLLDLRRSKASAKHEHFYKEMYGPKGVHPGDTKRRFLSRHGVGAGSADPNRMPYYLLIVGDPQTIPWEFQYQLDMQYAVGRIWFETPEEYGDYAQSVIEAEASLDQRKKTAAFFAPQNPDDEATKLSAYQLAAPLAKRMKGHGWTVREAVGEAATKARLREFLGGDETPDLLFTAGHGTVFASGDPRQLPYQGAVLCQDWPGPKVWKGKIPTDFYFSGEDVNGSDRLRGLVTFHFACYSAGGPAWDDFSIQREQKAVAPHPFIAHLPQRLLQKGALASIGHVERAWQCSIEWGEGEKGRHIEAFEDFLDRLVSGHPIGSAMEPFGQRYADLSTELSAKLEEIQVGKTPDDAGLASLWTDNHDARNYVVLGDPAVRLVAWDGQP